MTRSQAWFWWAANADFINGMRKSPSPAYVRDAIRVADKGEGHPDFIDAVMTVREWKGVLTAHTVQLTPDIQIFTNPMFIPYDWNFFK